MQLCARDLLGHRNSCVPDGCAAATEGRFVGLPLERTALASLFEQRLCHLVLPVHTETCAYKRPVDSGAAGNSCRRSRRIC